ncbi:hypothetical protein BJX62DRAFT_211371 [Aspergillus germanicus]
MTSSENAMDVIVVGAGFGGLATAIELAKAGCIVTVYELAKELPDGASSTLCVA